MGLFKRKDSKPSNNSQEFNEKASRSSGSFQDSNSSLKSPRPNMNGFPSPARIPEIPIPDAPDPAIDPAAYLRSIHAVRERSRMVYERAKRNELNHFDVDLSKFSETASYVVSIIKVGTWLLALDWRAFSLTASARLCRRLQIHSPTWAMAAFRSWWQATHQSTSSNVAQHYRFPRAYKTFGRPLPCFRSP
jgi:Protein of unknown function (DUF1688)